MTTTHKDFWTSMQRSCERNAASWEARADRATDEDTRAYCIGCVIYWADQAHHYFTMSREA